MKRYLAGLALLAVMAALCASPALGQQSGTVKGVCKDIDGKPIVGAQVEWVSNETGRKYDLKTNSKGEYFALGILPGHYKVTLSQGGKEIFHYGGFTVGLEESVLDFDMQKEQAAAAQGVGLSPEQAKAQQEQEAKDSERKRYGEGPQRETGDGKNSLRFGRLRYRDRSTHRSYPNGSDPRFALGEAWRL